MSWSLPLGARLRGDGVEFRVWAPDRRKVEVVVYDEPRETYPLMRDDDGYWNGHVAGLRAGARYAYRLDGGDPRPDPASRHQPDGVHGPSMVVDPAFPWTDGSWRGLPREEMIIYELHIGTATPEGTFEALIERLPELRELGITAIEIMPVADFPGDRNWGYDGVDLFAPARAYGGAMGLKRLVDAAHQIGLAVLLDVVYNHLGPSGNYLREYARDYFTDRHHTPWGDAINYDGPQSRAVRELVINNALYWAHEYHMDGLRLDATHAIIDDSPVHLLQELAGRVHASLPAGRHFVLFAEDGRNEARLARLPVKGGYGLDGIWADDFHHVVRVTLTGEQEGYYRYYRGGSEELARTLRGGWLFQGQVAPGTGKPRGTPADDLSPACFVYCIQNHDQIGNRAFGDRLHHGDLPPAAYRAASALLLLVPYTPMLFMGQEWAASSPFLFFTDHDPELGRLVTEGRRKEFKHFTAFSGDEVPDPQAAETFERSKLRWEERAAEPHAAVLRLYKALLDLRRLPALRHQSRQDFAVRSVGYAAVVLRCAAPSAADRSLVAVINLRGAVDVDMGLDGDDGRSWEQVLDTDDPRYRGMGEAEAPPAALEGGHIRLSGPRAVVFLGS